MLRNTCRLLSVVFVFAALFIAGCHQNAPRTSHSVVDIQGRKCEEMRTLVDNGRNRDFAYSYNCEGGGPPMGYMAAIPYMSPGMGTSEQAVMYDIQSHANPPDLLCPPRWQYYEDDKPTPLVLERPKECVPTKSVQSTQEIPLPQNQKRESAPRSHK
jgi:hypothetical protein